MMNGENSENSEIVVLGHNDLDQAGCLLSIKEALPNKIKFFETNYMNLPYVYTEIETYVRENNIQTLLVTDVSFNDDKETLIKLSKLCPKFLWIDHHHYDEGFFDDLDFKYIHDINKSATMLTYEFFKLSEKNFLNDGYFRLLIEMINAYDIWIRDSKFFIPGFDLNNYAKDFGVEFFADMLKERDYKLPDNYDAWQENNKKEFEAHYKKLTDSNRIFNAGEIAVIFTDDYINECILKAHENVLVVMVVNSYGLLRFRMHTKPEFNKRLKENIKDKITPVGHLNAYTIKTSKNNDEMMKDVQKYAGIIQKEFDSFNTK